MKVGLLVPAVANRESFRRNCQKHIPAESGCYALTTFDGDVLYVGLATHLRQRMGNHLDTPAKVAETAVGRAVWFWWLETVNLNAVERTWLNTHIQHEGALPILNRLYSPVKT